jgi:hypothetical protein
VNLGLWGKKKKKKKILGGCCDGFVVVVVMIVVVLKVCRVWGVLGTWVAVNLGVWKTKYKMNYFLLYFNMMYCKIKNVMWDVL